MKLTRHAIVSLLWSSLLPFALSNIVTVIEGEDHFGTLEDALVAAKLKKTLKGNGPFTLFAPNDEAFGAMDQKMLKKYIEDADWSAHTRALLLYHVSTGKLRAADVPAKGVEIATLLVDAIDEVAETVTVASSNNKVSVSGESFDSKVVEADLVAGNGIVHEVDTVFFPPQLTKNLLEAAQEIPTFRTVSHLVVLAGVDETLKNDVVTLFAPGQDILSTLDPGFISELMANNERIAELLNNHVVDGLWPSTKWKNGSKLTSHAGFTLTIATSKQETKVNEAIIEIFDAVASNGVVHAIDRLILPPGAP